MKSATVTAKGQITIPKSVRDALGLKEHDQVVFVVEGDRAIMRPIRRVELRQLRGIFRGREPFPGREAERMAAQAAVSERVRAAHEVET